MLLIQNIFPTTEEYIESKYQNKKFSKLKGIWALFAIAYLTMLLLGVLQGGFKC